jgi:hypothetical protein
MEVANHESGHAVAMYLCGRGIKEIDIARPDSWAEGWVVPEPAEPLGMPPDGIDPRDWVDGYLERSQRETAVIARIGAFAAGDAWSDPTCDVDRAIVQATRPTWLNPSGWETYVMMFVAEMYERPGFQRAVKYLSTALLDSPNEKMPGAVAVPIIKAAFWHDLDVNEDYSLRVNV